MNALEPLTTAVQARTPLVQLRDERPVHDIELDQHGFVTLRELFRQWLAEQGACLLTYSLAEGLRHDPRGLPPSTEAAVSEALRRHSLTISGSLATTISGLAALLGDPQHTVRFVILVLHAADAVGRVQDRCLLTEEQLRIRELVAGLGTSLHVRRRGHTVILEAARDSLDPAIEAVAVPVALAFPGPSEKELVLKAASARYPNGQLAEGLTLAAAARLTAGTPNLQTEAALRRAHCTSAPITAADLFRDKQEAVQSQSEGVLRLVTPEAVPLVGDYLAPARAELEHLCAGLAQGDPQTEALAVLHGPPGVGKSMLARTTATQADIPVYELTNMEHQYVGESQRRSKRFHWLRKQQAYVPNLIHADELNGITTRRDGNDSGVTEALHADWLTSLADPEYRGRSLIVATTNVPHRLPAALQSRCGFIPVFAPSPRDLVAILAQLVAHAGMDAEHEQVVEAAAILYGKGASPRDLGRMVRKLRRRHALNGVQLVTAASEFLVPDTAWQATIYCDYQSLLTMGDRTALPWRLPAEMPSHLAAVVDPQGAIDYDRVRARLAELRHVNV